VVPPRGPQRLAWQLLVEALLGALALVGLGVRMVLYVDARLRRTARRAWRKRRDHARPTSPGQPPARVA
jgi:hypothetical protein